MRLSVMGVCENLATRRLEHRAGQFTEVGRSLLYKPRFLYTAIAPALFPGNLIAAPVPPHSSLRKRSLLRGLTIARFERFFRPLVRQAIKPAERTEMRVEVASSEISDSIAADEGLARVMPRYYEPTP